MRYISSIIILYLLIFPAQSQNLSTMPIVKGVSWELATYRKKHISNLSYKMDLTIPEQLDLPIRGLTEIIFNLNNLSQDLQIDFKAFKNQIQTVHANGSRQKIKHHNEHIIIDKNELKIGQNKIKIKYNAGDDALNRSANFLYTLFVPDRMRTSFPSFDQPNLKATFELTLRVPESWETMSSNTIARETQRNRKKIVRFKKSDKMSTYLFSFVAGRFIKIKTVLDGLEMTMLHREPDTEKVNRNLKEIFSLHKDSINYMENYTGIKFPFQKFGFVLIPDFQFGGMEHIGAIQYRAASLMLDENPSTTDLLSRASLIGHETSHMWFGDLVTMDWFDDVWTKEVFANFFAAKMIYPNFPGIDHQLRSHLRLHPGAYAVDRSEGSNPIRQQLPNLNEAGNLYGAIIYNKAPIMMQQLEKLLGEDLFREGVREYLSTYAFSNATWPDLISILDKRSEKDLNAWSDVWVNTSGMPTFNTKKYPDKGLILSQTDPSKMKRIWSQTFEIRKGNQSYNVPYLKKEINLNKFDNNLNEKILLNSDGMGYGLFSIEKNFLRENWGDLSDLERASAFVKLYEQLMQNNGTIEPQEYIELIIWAVGREKNPLIINHIMRQTIDIYWSLFNQKNRIDIAPFLEKAIWNQVVNEAHNTGIRRIYFRNYANLALTPSALSNVQSVWNESLKIKNLNLSTRDYTNIAASLAIKIPNSADQIIETQLLKIKGPDNKARFQFIIPALSSDQYIRDNFFSTLMKAENRHTEPWVLSALRYLHHPLRIDFSEGYLKRSLNVLEDIQITGDIFFPGRWLNATFKYYQSDVAIATVNNFLTKNPDYNYQLKLKILQNSDQMKRANKILKNTT